MKNVLVVYYTQSGQLKQIANSIALPLLEDSTVNVVYYEIQMEKPFPFPWNKQTFFNVFPESFLQVPAQIKPVPDAILNTKFDLVLLHYQVWFLSPSIPVTSFLKSSYAAKILYNTPVVTISGSRNMWFLAQDKVKTLLKNNNSHLVGNIALTDRAPHLISVLTIVNWMFSGVKRKQWGILPLPGVSDKDITGAKTFGYSIKTALFNNTFKNLQQKLISQGAVKVKPYLVAVDKKGNYVFGKWAGIIIKKEGKTRQKLLNIFVVYLVLAIWIVSPIVYILHIIIWPFKINRIKKETAYYKGV